MPKLDDSDDEQGWEDNSKFDGKEDDASRAKPLPEIVQAFVHYVSAAKFRKAIHEFLAANARPFEDADVDSEQRLEWTETYERYAALIEQLLEDFCAMKQTTAEAVFTEVRRVMMTGGLDEEFLPTALRICEYDHFIEQISLVANEPRHKRDAEDSAEESKEDETSAGVWKLDGRATDLERLDDYLAAVGVPFVFKGLARGCLFTTKGLIIILNDRRKTATIISDATTGRRREVYVCDGAAQKVRNGWGNEIAMRASILPGGCLTIENLEPPSLPPRSTVTTRYEPDGAKMVCSIEVRNGATGRTVRQTLVYGRLTAGKKGKGKGGGGGAAPAPKSHK